MTFEEFRAARREDRYVFLGRNLITCVDCSREIEQHEEFTRQDKTGFVICLDCSDNHVDVTMAEGKP